MKWDFQMDNLLSIFQKSGPAPERHKYKIHVINNLIQKKKVGKNEAKS